MKFLLSLITIVLISCGHGKQLTFPEHLKNLTPVDTTKLRFDGYYTQCDTTVGNDGSVSNDVFLGIRKVIFTKNNKVWIDHGADIDQRTLSCKYFKKYVRLK